MRLRSVADRTGLPVPGRAFLSMPVSRCKPIRERTGNLAPGGPQAARGAVDGVRVSVRYRLGQRRSGAGLAGRDSAAPFAFSVSLAAEPGVSLRSACGQGRRKPEHTLASNPVDVVDDPRSSLELAAGLVDDSVESIVMSVKEQQHSLLSAWQSDDAGTEELRTTLRQYRAFWNRLEDFSVRPDHPRLPLCR